MVFTAIQQFHKQQIPTRLHKNSNLLVTFQKIYLRSISVCCLPFITTKLCVTLLLLMLPSKFCFSKSSFWTQKSKYFYITILTKLTRICCLLPGIIFDTIFLAHITFITSLWCQICVFTIFYLHFIVPGPYLKRLLFNKLCMYIHSQFCLKVFLSFPT